MSWISSLVVGAVVLVGSFAMAAEGKLQGYVEGLNPGWNLGNTFDATGEETSWGNPATTKALIDRIAADGFKSIRIPITWQHRMGGAPDYLIRPEFMQRVQQVVDWSLAAGLTVMINMHHDSGWVAQMETKRDEVTDRFDAAWRQIADAFKDYPHTVMFEGINEPKFSSDWGKEAPEYFEMLRALNTSFVKIVRASGGKNADRPLVLSTIAAASAQARLDDLYETITGLKDENLIGTVHYYGYWPFSVNIAGATTFDARSQADVKDMFERVHKTLAARGVPVIIGEYGLLGFDKSTAVVQHGEILKFFEAVGHHARETKMPLMWWDNGQHFDRREMQWRDPRLFAMVMTSATERSAYAERDAVYVKRGAAAEDKTLKLTLNGRKLERVTVGERELKRGSEYEVKGEAITFKAGLLKELVGEGLGEELGVAETVQLAFSGGEPWLVRVVQYERPVLEAATGETGKFVIPVEFNGDTLVTMQAVYAGGGNAGPANWTPYKEFLRSFVPDAEAGHIRLTPEFFKEVKDGEVVLKFHFWSGEVVEYRVKKEGDGVEGK